MELLGIGPLEFIFILLIALIILGPSDMIKAGRTIGRFLRQLVTSPNWRVFTQASREIRNLPNKLMREAGLDEEINELKKLTREADLQPDLKQLDHEMHDWGKDISSWTTPPPTNQLKTPENPASPEPRTQPFTTTPTEPKPPASGEPSETIIASPEPPVSEKPTSETEAD